MLQLSPWNNETEKKFDAYSADRRSKRSHRQLLPPKPHTETVLFGSVLTPRFGPDSDVDFLVEFEPETPISYFDLVGMEAELSKVIGRKVDLRTAEELSRYFRDKVVASAMPQYERY